MAGLEVPGRQGHGFLNISMNMAGRLKGFQTALLYTFSYGACPKLSCTTPSQALSAGVGGWCFFQAIASRQ